MMCCDNGNSEMVNFLLDSEANPDLQQSVEYHKHKPLRNRKLSPNHGKQAILALGMQTHANVLNGYILPNVHCILCFFLSLAPHTAHSLID